MTAMKMNRLVYLGVSLRPFVLSTSHCLDWECNCSNVSFTLTEIASNGNVRFKPLVLAIQVDSLKLDEIDPPIRSAEVTGLVREFVFGLSSNRIKQFLDERTEERRIARRLSEFVFKRKGSSELVTYSEVVFERGGVADGLLHYSFYFRFEERDFLIEDNYCPTPQCDCKQVHIEFWELTRQSNPERTFKSERDSIAIYSLYGKLRSLQAHERDPAFASRIASAWESIATTHQGLFLERYQQIKKIGDRSFPADKSTASVAPTRATRIGRNDPCPCGSGRKFKQCCLRNETGLGAFKTQ